MQNIKNYTQHFIAQYYSTSLKLYFIFLWKYFTNANFEIKNPYIFKQAQ